MYRLINLLLLIFVSTQAQAQVSVNFTVDTGDPQGEISPLIYGTNSNSLEISPANRTGGNRWSGYNWENNASHAGADWYHHNDNYLPWNLGIPSNKSDNPGICLRAIHERNLAGNTYTLLTLPMAGYASRDKDGEVTVPETAPSPRWLEVINRKGAPYSFPPDTSDSVLYTDELLDYLTNSFGPAGSENGIEAYSLDNEPGLWAHTHPRLHPDPVTVANLMTRSGHLAATIKEMDPEAEIFGPALYGFSAYLNLQDAPDWGDYSDTYNRFVETYLDLMRITSETAGVRLLDVLDVHWYPEPAGVYNGDTTRVVAETRMQLPRSLWDPSYVEDSWIGQWFSPVEILNYLQDAIATFYPGTKLAITEYDYGAPDHISGGIAQIDALGIFGRYNVYFGSKWGAVDQYIRSAYRLYLDYDGAGGQFGAFGVAASTSNIETTSLYGALDDDHPERLHLILVNKSYDDAVAGEFQLSGQVSYTHGESWRFTRSDTLIYAGPTITVGSDNSFTYGLPPLSAHHLVLYSSSSSVDEEIAHAQPSAVKVVPDPARLIIRLFASAEVTRISGVKIFDASGRIIHTAVSQASGGEIEIDAALLRPGIYFVRAEINGTSISKKVIWTR